jgi:hypothetical protein
MPPQPLNASVFTRFMAALRISKRRKALQPVPARRLKKDANLRNRYLQVPDLFEDDGEE